MYGEGVLTVHRCQNWFSKFRSDNFNMYRLNQMNNTTREIVTRSNLSDSTVRDLVKRLVCFIVTKKTKLLFEQPNIYISASFLIKIVERRDASKKVIDRALDVGVFRKGISTRLPFACYFTHLCPRPPLFLHAQSVDLPISPFSPLSLVLSRCTWLPALRPVAQWARSVTVQQPRF